MNLHGLIMNLPSRQIAENLARDMDYQLGHRDARHATAEVALKADACIEALRALDARLRECARLGLTAAEAYDSFYEETVAEALHGLDRLPLVLPNVKWANRYRGPRSAHDW